MSLEAKVKTWTSYKHYKHLFSHKSISQIQISKEGWFFMLQMIINIASLAAVLIVEWFSRERSPPTCWHKQLGMYWLCKRAADDVGDVDGYSTSFIAWQ